MAIDLNKIRQRVAELNGEKRLSSAQLWKPGAGEFRIRGLPALNAKEGMPFEERRSYFIGTERAFLAPKQFGKPDPVAELVSSLYKSGTPEDKEMAKLLRPKMYAHMPIIVRGEEDKGVVIWKFGTLVYKDLMALFTMTDDGEVLDFLDPNKGFDLQVIVSKSPKKFNGNDVMDYKVTIPAGRKASKLHTDQAITDKWMTGRPNVDELHKSKSYDEIKTVLDNWLNGDPQATPSDGTARGTASSDALENLTKDLQNSAPVAEPKGGKKPSVRPPASTGNTKEDLDAAFDDLMKED